jgi:hypothetical protein
MFDFCIPIYSSKKIYGPTPAQSALKERKWVISGEEDSGLGSYI